MSAMRVAWGAICGAVCLGIACGTSQAQAPLKGENLLVGMPQGFKVGFQDSGNGMNMQEWVPANETVQNWTEMVTVQVFLKRSDLDPVQFLATMAQQWAGACKGSTATPAAMGKANGYTSATTLLRCPLLASSGKPETTMIKAIKGSDSFYVVQRAARSVPSEAQLARTKAYLDTVSVCDSRLPAHPCLMPGAPK
jgi:hypothetical protein